MRHIESQLQQACFKWFRLQYPDLAMLMFAVPNGGARRRIEACIMKAEGVTAGVADVLFLYPNANYHGLCIEFKTKTGRQQQSQKTFQQAVERKGYKYVIIRDIDDFIRLIKSYIFDTRKD